MPKIRTKKTKKAPKGWKNIEETLMELTQKMRDGKLCSPLQLLGDFESAKLLYL